MPSSSPNDQFTINNKSNNKGNNAKTIIDELFLNIRQRSSYDRLTEKTIHKTYEFFMHFPRHMTSNNRITLDNIRSGLRLFQALEIFFILQIKVDIENKGIMILVDEIGYRKVRYLVFKKCVLNAIRQFNV